MSGEINNEFVKGVEGKGLDRSSPAAAWVDENQEVLQLVGLVIRTVGVNSPHRSATETATQQGLGIA